MSNQGFLNSKLSVHLLILIGKYLSQKTGYRISRNIASIISFFPNLNINKSIRANQFIVNGETNSRKELDLKSKNVLTHAGHCYYDLYHYYNRPEKLDAVVPLTEPMKEFIKLSQDKQGYMVVAPHLSNFDLVVSRLAKSGFRGNILSYPNPGSGYQLQNKIRSAFGLDVTPLGDSGVETKIIQFLKDGGMAATGIDRPVPGRKKRHYVKFFGKPSPLPVGYLTTALAADVPIIAVAAFMLPNGTYGFRHSGPIQLKKYQNKLDEIILNTETVLKKIEAFIKLAPEQWLMYYPVWPEHMKEGV